MGGILVATDFSDASRKAVTVAAQMAQDLGHGVILVHALLPPSSHRSKYGSDPIGRLEQDIGREEALKFHREWAEPLRKGGLDVTTVVEEGRAADVVLDAAKEHDAAFIVIGRQGWGRLERLRLGSVSKKVAARTDRPVVLVPSRS